MSSPRDELLRAHEPHAIRQRMGEPVPASYVSDAVLGGIDGCITTFAVVAGTIGAGLPPWIAVVLGFANLVADGVSMAASNYESTHVQRERADQLRRIEERHIAEVPEGEREEVREIFRNKGFDGETLERIVATISGDRELWIQTMLTEEYGLEKSLPDERVSAAVTFFAFVLVGAVPLLPLLVAGLGARAQFGLSMLLAGAVFFAIGMLKGRALGQRPWRAGSRTLVIGGGAAVLAYSVGAWLGGLHGGA